MDRKKYDFFKYLYNVYVKDKDILKMIDTYDVKRNLNKLDYDYMSAAPLLLIVYAIFCMIGLIVINIF